jgi:pyruvate,orthophosphate dikinase
MSVFANAETLDDVHKAAELGAEGIGLCRTEHMFFSHPDRINAMRAMILADSCEEREKQLNTLLPYQQNDFLEIFKSFSDKIITVRYIDPPLHEFLPVAGTASYNDELSELAKLLDIEEAECERRVDAYREKNPSKLTMLTFCMNLHAESVI